MMLQRIVIVAMAVTSAYSLAISHYDLEGANRTCDGKASCERVKATRMGDDLDWRERNCFCDQLCTKYGDCCTDSPFFDVVEQRRGLASFSCVELRQFGGIYMKDTCPPDWDNMETRSACETASDQIDDPLAGIPATSHTTGITYRNTYCALCHKETDLDVWHPRLECPGLFTAQRFNLTDEELAEAVGFSEKEGFWGLTIGSKFHACAIDPVLPETSSHIVRRCQYDVVKACAFNWTNVEVRNRCEAYTSIVYLSQVGYRNPHCAMCNNVPLQYLQCYRTDFRAGVTREFNPSAFALLFDLSGGSVVGKIQPCKEDELYDPFFKRCRAVLNELKSKTPTKPSPPSYKVEHYDNSGEENTTISFVLAFNDTLDYVDPCPKFVLERDDYVIVNDTVYVPQYKKTFKPEEFEIREDETLEVCVGSLGVKLVDKFGIYMGYVTYAGLGISIIFLMLHLAAFALISELRNLSGKNLASFCISLLVAYTAFMAGQVLEGTACFVVATITYYFFLASFTWMLTMAFDVWRTLRLATSELRVSAGKQWRKFAIYSVWSWLAPAVVVASAMFVETAPEDAVPADWRPEFAVHSCWFGSRKALWLFFAGPLACIMAFNIGFFASSAHMIYSTTSTTRFTASAGTQRDFRLYARLAVVMGLTWSVGLAAGTLDVDVLWYIFVALNTLQGLFIFLAFTCTDKVIRALAIRKSDSKPLRPPSFSWSSDSTRKSQMGSEHGTTDTLY